MAHIKEMLKVRANNRQYKHVSHPGQAKSSARKHANRSAKRLELETAAKTKGIAITELVRQRNLRVENIRVNYAVNTETRVPVVQPSEINPPPWLSWLH